MRLLKSIVYTLTMALLVVVSVSAQESDPTTDVTPVPQFDSQGYIRIGHFVPDGMAVDIYLDNETVAENVEYTQLSPWTVVPTGSHDLAISEVGTPVNDAILQTTIDIAQDTWMTVGFVVSEGDVNISLIRQAMYTDLPGTAQITFANALVDGETVDFTRDDVVFVADVPVIVGEVEVQNSIPVDAQNAIYNFMVNDAPTSEGTEVETVGTSAYLIVVFGSTDNPQLLIDETPNWRIRLLDGTLEAPGTLLQAMESEPLAEPFLAAVEAANLTDILTASDPITIFVPANYVMDDVDLSREDLADVLRQHIVEGNYKIDDLTLETTQLTTLDGSTLSVEGQFIDGVEIIDVDLSGSNGTIHIINDLLIAQPE